MPQLYFKDKTNSLEAEIGSLAALKFGEKEPFYQGRKITANQILELDEIEWNENFIFKGDNLPILYSLKSHYRERVKLIYIDPPYNTGKGHFGYPDNMTHDAWLGFMKNRLEIAKAFLHEKGVIFISIDKNEMAYLKVLCDEIFGRHNYVGDIIWENASDNNATQISTQHEYLLCYAKQKTSLDTWQLTSDKASQIITRYEEIKAEKGGDDPLAIQYALRAWINSMRKNKEYDLSGVAHYNHVDEKGVFYPGNSSNPRLGGYELNLIHPVSGKICKKPLNGYRWPEKTFWAAEAKGDILWPKDETGIPRMKKRIETAKESLKSYYFEDSRSASNALNKRLEGKKFKHPKPISLLKRIIRFVTEPDDFILDFFAGSGSTAHALMEVNKEEGSDRKFLLIEKTDFVEEVIIPRLQKVMEDEVIQFCTLNHQVQRNEHFYS